MAEQPSPGKDSKLIKDIPEPHKTKGGLYHVARIDKDLSVEKESVGRVDDGSGTSGSSVHENATFNDEKSGSGFDRPGTVATLQKGPNTNGSKIKRCCSSITSKCLRPCRTYCVDIFTVKSVDDLEADSRHSSMKKTLNYVDVTLFGIGAIIGSGIFVLTGLAAGNNAGPAVVISFIIAGVASGLAGLCYAEMASMIPVSGSAYTYSYATMGELMAWIIGWDLILEYLVGAAAVSVGWSSYVVSFIKDVGGASVIYEPIVNAPFGYNETNGTAYFYLTDAYINIPAVAIVLALTLLLVVGVKESAVFNGITVTINVAVVLIFIFGSIKWIDRKNWEPFIPENEGFGRYGWSGIFQATTMVFFAYIGFDSVSTTAQECRRPQKDLPIGIMASLFICSVLYIAVCICLTGIIPYHKLAGSHSDTASPMSKAAEYIGQTWLSITVEVGAIAGLTSVMLVSLLSQPRIFFSMARDGLFPACAARTHPRFGTPVVTTLITGIITAIVGGLFPIDILGELTSVGTLFAFVLVSLAVMILRIKRPDLPRKFKVPLGPYVIPLLSAAASAALIFVSTTQTILRLAIWMIIGFVIYFVYGKRHSKLQKKLREQRSAGLARIVQQHRPGSSHEMASTVETNKLAPPSATGQ